MFPECLRSQLARAACEPLSVVKPGRGVEQPLGSGPVGVELGVHVGADLKEDLVRVVRRRDALPSTGTQRGKPLRARGSLADHQENWRAAGDARIGPERAAQLNARHVGHLGVHKDHVWLGGARALEGMLTGALLEDGRRPPGARVVIRLVAFALSCIRSSQPRLRRGSYVTHVSANPGPRCGGGRQPRSALQRPRLRGRAAAAAARAQRSPSAVAARRPVGRAG